LRYAIDDLIAEGGKVAVRWTATGTNKGELLGMPATGRQVTVGGVDIFRLAKGRLVELWLSWDQLGMMQQLGIIPTLG
jgi:predicted ester cyclase